MSALAHAVRLALGRWIGSVHLNRIQTSTSQGEVRLLKTRCWSASLLIPVGNLYLRGSDCLSEVLAETTWRDWEFTLVQAGICANPNEGLPVHGTTLHEALKSRTYSLPQKLQYVQSALTSLARLHQHEILWDDRQLRRFSHGDATSRNVCIDSQSGTAVWIDFDTRHRREVSAMERASDDFRALIFSSATAMDDVHFDQLAESCFRTLKSLTDIRDFLARLSWNYACASIFQLAQAPLSYRRFHGLRTALLRAGEQNDNFSKWTRRRSVPR